MTEPTRVIVCSGDLPAGTTCPVCKRKNSHHEACPVPVLGGPSASDPLMRPSP